jgi:hypothetical protein
VTGSTANGLARGTCGITSNAGARAANTVTGFAFCGLVEGAATGVGDWCGW